MKSTDSIHFASMNHIGANAKREFEDRTFVGNIRTKSNLDFILGIVADGVGGMPFGERAANAAIEIIQAAIEKSTLTDVLRILRDALEKANNRICSEGISEPWKKGMCTTVAIVAVCNYKLYIANVGDCRIYLFRNKGAIQITREQLDPLGNHVIQVVGQKGFAVDCGLYLQLDELEGDAIKNQGLPFVEGDSILICSDGLYRCVKPNEMVSMVNALSPESSAKSLIKLAISRNTNDNASAIIIKRARPSFHNYLKNRALQIR